jgi:hypothetical protein
MGRLRERMMLSLPTRHISTDKRVQALRILLQDLSHGRVVFLDTQTEQTVL